MSQLKTKRKAVRYRRVSGKSQKDNFSLQNQDIRSAKYCVEKGLPLDRDFEDVGSGLSIKNRHGFVEMTEYVLDKINDITEVVFTATLGPSPQTFSGTVATARGLPDWRTC